MAHRFDPRGDLGIYYQPLPPHERREANIWLAARPGATQPYIHSSRMTTRGDYQQPSPLVAVACHDWIFSSASNVHVAIDRSAFKTYTSFKTHVLTVSDQSPIKVRGIGTVEVKIRRQPGSKESHTVTLENVLHVPKWMCNIFSDIYFEPINAFEYAWTDFGVSFLKKENSQLTYWGFTESFLGLERLVLAKKTRGRSPMLEDHDREVFSVNLTWPQGQRDKWEAQLSADERKRHDRQEMKLQREARSGLIAWTEMTSPTKTLPKVSLDLQREQRSGLTDLSANIMHRRAPSERASSLKAITARSRGSSFTERFSTLV